jgi:hypothetical protein
MTAAIKRTSAASKGKAKGFERGKNLKRLLNPSGRGTKLKMPFNPSRSLARSTTT